MKGNLKASTVHELEGFRLSKLPYLKPVYRFNVASIKFMFFRHSQIY